MNTQSDKTWQHCIMNSFDQRLTLKLGATYPFKHHNSDSSYLKL